MKRIMIVLLALLLTLGLLPAASAVGQVVDEGSSNMELTANWDDGGAYREGSDLAFWRNTAVLGKYHGLTLLDVSDPDEPELLGKLTCNGNQNDVSIWRHLVFVSVDSPMQHSGCDAAPVSPNAVVPGTIWEGLRVIDVSDPSEPKQIAAVYTDCGSHTHTLVPDLHHRDAETGKRDPRVIVYQSSYPLTGQGERCSAASHRKVSVVSVPLHRPTEARVVNVLDVSPAVGCHDITIFQPRKLAGAACITESQIWDVTDPVRPVVLSRIRNPAMQIHHSSAWSWDGDVLVLGDEKGGAAAAGGCMAGGRAPTGALWFYDVSDPIRPVQQSWFVIPQDETSTMCTAHNFNVVPTRDGSRVLVTSWYHGGTHVLDFTDARNPKQIGWYKPKEGVRGTSWSSYWYNGRIFANNFDAGYVPSVPQSRGLDVFAVDHPVLAEENTVRLFRLNPQTQETIPALRGRQGEPVSAEARARAAATPPPLTTGALPASSPFCVLA